MGSIPTGPTHGEGRLQPHPGDVLRSTPNVRKSPRSGLNLEGRLSDPQFFSKVTAKMIPKTTNVPIVRTDFTNEASWTTLCQALEQKSKDGFIAYLDLINDIQYQGINPQMIDEILPPDFPHLIIVLADNQTFSSSELCILCIEHDGDSRRSFRVIPSEMWAVENNLSICNCDFDDFLGSEDGVFRGLW